MGRREVASQRGRGQDGEEESHILIKLLEGVMGGALWRILMVPWELVMGRGLLRGLTNL